MKKYCMVLLAVLTLLGGHSRAAGPEFTLHKLGPPGQDEPVMLIVGGIQGDEPGGFNAASLLVTHYAITHGRVWVVPNLNFISIIERSRGLYGDLNRKFFSLDEHDPEFDTIRRIKGIILNEDIGVVLNLHDGSGFYRPTYIDRLHNPRRWGQSVIIDQNEIGPVQYGNLADIAGAVVERVNCRLIAPEHCYHVNNTRTARGNAEMEKTLTYFAIRQGKPAFGLEVSKSFPTCQRVYYHLQLIESFMELMGIEFERRLELTRPGVDQAINSNVNIAFYDNRIFFDMCNARSRLGYVPLKKDAEIDVTLSNPLLALVDEGTDYRVHYGNRRLAKIQPQYFEYDTSIDTITMTVDGVERDVRFGGVVDVASAFAVSPRSGYRINVIGFTRPGLHNESGVLISRSDIMERFSVDRAGHTYRVEVYREDRFSGMVLVNFDERLARSPAPAPETVSFAEIVPRSTIR